MRVSGMLTVGFINRNFTADSRLRYQPTTSRYHIEWFCCDDGSQSKDGRVFGGVASRLILRLFYAFGKCFLALHRGTRAIRQQAYSVSRNYKYAIASSRERDATSQDPHKALPFASDGILHSLLHSTLTKLDSRSRQSTVSKRYHEAACKTFSFFLCFTYISDLSLYDTPRSDFEHSLSASSTDLEFHPSFARVVG